MNDSAHHRERHPALHGNWAARQRHLQALLEGWVAGEAVAIYRAFFSGGVSRTSFVVEERDQAMRWTYKTKSHPIIRPKFADGRHAMECGPKRELPSYGSMRCRQIRKDEFEFAKSASTG